MNIAGLPGPQLSDRLPSAANANLNLGKAVDASSAKEGELRKQFDTFVGESFYGQMLSSMRKTVGKPAYFHGGQAEEVFRGQLDQMLASKLSNASVHNFTGPIFDLFS